MSTTTCILKTILFCGLFLPFMALAQNVKEGVVKVGKDKKKGFIATSEYSKALVAEAFETKLREAGLKKRSKKHKFYVYKGVTWSVASDNKVDLYYKVSSKKSKSRLYVVASKGYDNYITSETDAQGASSISGYLAKLDAAIAQSEDMKKKEAELQKLNKSVEEQKANLKKAEDAKRVKSEEIIKKKAETY